jgi:hypothetical protein
VGFNLRASLSCDPFFGSARVTITCAHEHHSRFSPWVVKNRIWVLHHYRGLHTKGKMKRSFRDRQAPHYLFCAVVLATTVGLFLRTYLPEMAPPPPHVVRLGFFVAVMQIMMGQLRLFAELARIEHDSIRYEIQFHVRNDAPVVSAGSKPV